MTGAAMLGTRLANLYRAVLAVNGRLADATSGATAIEYGLIAALIAVAAVTVMGTVGTNLSSTFNNVASSL